MFYKFKILKKILNLFFFLFNSFLVFNAIACGTSGSEVLYIDKPDVNPNAAQIGDVLGQTNFSQAVIVEKEGSCVFTFLQSQVLATPEGIVGPSGTSVYPTGIPGLGYALIARNLSFLKRDNVWVTTDTSYYFSGVDVYSLYSGEYFYSFKMDFEVYLIKTSNDLDLTSLGTNKLQLMQFEMRGYEEDESSGGSGTGPGGGPGGGGYSRPVYLEVDISRIITSATTCQFEVTAVNLTLPRVASHVLNRLPSNEPIYADEESDTQTVLVTCNGRITPYATVTDFDNPGGSETYLRNRGDAQGVGIALKRQIDQGPWVDVIFAPASTQIGGLNQWEIGEIDIGQPRSISFKAYYIKTGQRVVGGSVESIATVVLAYQ